MKTKAIILTLATILMVACGSSSTDSSNDSVNDSVNDQEVGTDPDLPSQGYDRALERARGVEQDVMDAAQRQREQIEEQEGGN